MLEIEAHDAEIDAEHDAKVPSLGTSVAPIVVPLLMIAFGAFADLAGVTNDFIDFIGNATLALFVGLLWAYLLARRSIGVERTNDGALRGLPHQR